MNEYCDRFGITGREYEVFLEILEGLDTTYLAETATKGKTGGKKP